MMGSVVSMGPGSYSTSYNTLYNLFQIQNYPPLGRFVLLFVCVLSIDTSYVLLLLLVKMVVYVCVHQII